MIKKGLILMLLLIGLQCLFISTASAQTKIGDDEANIESAVTWDLANSPYIITTDVSVSSEGSLTIQPGVVVKFNNQKGLYVDGTLNAQGTADKPIVFTDSRDDAAGGDSNSDGTATMPTAGYWAGIKIDGTATINYGVVRYAGYYNEADIYKTGTEPLTLSNSTLSNSSNDGLRIRYSEGASAVNNCTFKDNKRYGVYCEDIETDSYTGTGNTFTNNSKAPVCIDGGTLKHDVTWNQEASPYYIINDVTVDETAALTLSPGVVVKFAKDQGLYIDGTLNATGSPDLNIYFTDYRDDASGGDTNGDSAATKPAAGWWGGIKVSGAGAATILDCVVRYAGYYNESGIYKTGTGLLTLANSTISDSSNDGLRIRYSEGASAVNNCTFKDNKRYGVYCEDIETDSYTGTGNTFSNNLKAPVCIDGGTLKHDVTWNREASPYYICNEVTVDENAVLTVNPDVVVKFAQAKGLAISGTLTAQGAPSGSGSPGAIYFTDYRDDLAGGDTNGDGAASKPALSWWEGIKISDAGTATLDNCVVRYGGNYYNSNIYKTGSGELNLTNSEISNSSASGLKFNYNTGNSNIANNKFHSNKVGISCQGSELVIGGSLAKANQIYQNSDFGVENESDDSTINAKYNWWGDATGPTHGTNPLGKGDKVSDYVDFGNFLTSLSSQISETLKVSSPSTTGFKVTLNPALAGLTGSDFILKDDLNKVVTITSAVTTDDGATYTISAALIAGKNYTVTAAKTGYDFGTAQSVVVPTKIVKSLLAAPLKLKLLPDQQSDPITLTATYTDNSTENVTEAATWQSNNPSVATIDTAGGRVIVTGVANGSTTIAGTYGGQTAIISVTVSDGTTPQLVDLLVQPDTISVTYGKTQAVKVYAVYSNDSEVDVTKLAILVSQDPKIATVTRGMVKGVGVGETSLSVTYLEQTTEIPVTVTPPVVKLTPDQSVLNLLIGESETINLTASYKNGDDYEVPGASAIWKSSKPKIATVDEYGEVTGVAIGVTTITGVFGGKTATITVNITPELEYISVEPGKVGVAKGKTQVVKIFAVYINGNKVDITKMVRLTSDDPTIATVTGATIKGVAADCETVITGSYLGQDIEILVKVTPPLKTLEEGTGTTVLNLAVEETETLTVSATYNNGDTEDVTDYATYISSKPNVATVVFEDGVMTVTGVTAGSAKITLSYGGKKIAVKVNVTN